jgi:hypothetical protein
MHGEHPFYGSGMYEENMVNSYGESAHDGTGITIS